MKVLVCGGRDETDVEFVQSQLHEVLKDWAPITHVIHGGAAGVDAIAAEWALRLGIQVVTCHANWDAHGKAAGPIRNRRMLELGPDLVVAFRGGRGTAGMVGLARQRNVPVIRPGVTEVI